MNSASSIALLANCFNAIFQQISVCAISYAFSNYAHLVLWQITGRITTPAHPLASLQSLLCFLCRGHVEKVSAVANREGLAWQYEGLGEEREGLFV